jgi:hypothetical protein
MLIDCSTCGGPLPVGRSCCPHCHCTSPAWKRWALVAAAAASLGAVDCGGNPEPVVEYGLAPQHDFAGVDEAVSVDQAEPPDGGSGDL